MAGAGAGAKAQEVDAFLTTLKHSCKAEILELRQVILSADSRIQEGIKWNAPSFRTTEHFATMHLRTKQGVGVIMHFGAKKRDIKPRADIADPAQLLVWLADDRAVVAFQDMADIHAKHDAYVKLIAEWIKHV